MGEFFLESFFELRIDDGIASVRSRLRQGEFALGSARFYLGFKQLVFEAAYFDAVVYLDSGIDLQFYIVDFEKQV